MKILNKFIWSKIEPKNKNDVWFDGSVFNLYRNDTWEAFTLPVDAAEKVAEVIKNALNVFQSKLTAGKGISIKEDVISTTSLFKVVNVLPEIGEEDVIYLVYTESSDIENKLVEYIWVENHFEKLGEFKADVDLSEYVKKEELAIIQGDAVLAAKLETFGVAIIDFATNEFYISDPLNGEIIPLHIWTLNATVGLKKRGIGVHYVLENGLPGYTSGNIFVDKTKGGLPVLQFTAEGYTYTSVIGEDGSISFTKEPVKLYDDTEIRNKIAQKASTEGYYPKMEVGKADNLPDRVDVTEGAITFRESAGEGNSIEDGTCEVKELCGNTLVWNQQLKYALSQADYGKQGWWSRYGEAHMEGRKVTFAAREGFGPFISQACDIVKGHAYLLVFDFSAEYTDLYKRAYAFAFSNDAYGNGTQTIFGTKDVLNGHRVHFLTANNNFSYSIFRISNTDLSSTPASTATLENYQLIDLTKMFGAGNEPTTIEEFYKRIPVGVDLYAYNEGEIVNVNINGIKSVNDNAWDEEWEVGSINAEGELVTSTTNIRSKNFCKCLPNASYAISSSVPANKVSIFWYDKNKSFLERVYIKQIGMVFNSPLNAAYFMVRYDATLVYENNVCIRLAHSGYKTDYVPHEEDTMPLDLAKYFPNGMNGVNGVSDSLSMNEKVQRFGVVDLGTLDWKYAAGNISKFSCLMPSDARQFPGTDLPNMVTYLYVAQKYDIGISRDKSIYRAGLYLGILDSSYTDAESFKAAMQGVMLYYELAEPIVEEIYPPLNLSYKVWDFGTEEILTDGASAPLITKAIYGFNATDTIRGNKAKIAQNTEEIVKLRNEIAQAIGNVINGEY